MFLMMREEKSDMVEAMQTIQLLINYFGKDNHCGNVTLFARSTVSVVFCFYKSVILF